MGKNMDASVTAVDSGKASNSLIRRISQKSRKASLDQDLVKAKTIKGLPI